MVQKNKKFKHRFRPPPPSSGPRTLPEASWKHVKLSGPVISDEGGDLAGLIGLEILENYDRSLVNKDKKKVCTYIIFILSLIEEQTNKLFDRRN